MHNIFSRVYVVWAVLYMCPTSQLSFGFPMLLFAWTITEIIRYSMYAFNLVGSPPYFLTWLRFDNSRRSSIFYPCLTLSRYTFFIIAYPIGVSGELICSYVALVQALEQDILSIHLPNMLNATFSFPLIILVIMLSYIPLFPPMYMYMFGQRKKVLGVKKEE